MCKFTCLLYLLTNNTENYNYLLGVLVAQRLGRRTSDQAVVGSIPDRGVIIAPRSTQPSIPPG